MYARILTLFFLFFISLSNFYIFGQDIEFEGYINEPIKVNPPISTGLNALYVVNGTNGLRISYKAASNNLEWLYYSDLGGGYALQVENVEKTGLIYSINNPMGNHGYIIRDNGTTFAFWLVDYSTYNLKLEKISEAEDSGCDITKLDFIGDAPPITYYSINGKKEVLSRDLSLSYNTLVWNESQEIFQQFQETKNLDYIENSIVLSPAILCQTRFQLTGDQFLETWGRKEVIESEIFEPIAVEVRAKMFANDSSDNDSTESNQIGGDGVSLSAPYSASFESFSSDAVVHYEWQIGNDPAFENIDYRIYSSDLDYTFTEEGVYYIRFIGSNSNGSCEAFSETFSLNIGSSELLIPNAFSPNGDGINDIWKVAYRSLLEFKCWIFDRQGHKIFYFDNPDEGWDGKNGTKFVNSGVYFYVIEALGADGKKYKKSGDINILNSYSSGSYTEEY